MNDERGAETKLQIEAVIECYRGGKFEDLDHLLASGHPADIASLIEALPRDIRTPIWQRVPLDMEGSVLVELGEDVRASLVASMDATELASATQDLSPEELVELIEPLPEATSQAIIGGLNDVLRQQVETNLSFDDDEAGRLLRVDAIVVKSEVTLEVVHRYLRRRAELPDHTDCLMVVDEQGKYCGVLKLESLLLQSAECMVSEVMLRDFDAIEANWHEDQVAQLFERHDLISVPVIDQNQSLLGRITIDDVVDVIREQADEEVFGRVGMDHEEDLFAPAQRSAWRRAIWLGVNLLTAILASWVIGVFSETIKQIVALAVLMPIVASMGGIAGSQTLTLTIRGLATGLLHRGNLIALLYKELSVGVINSIIWSGAVAILVVYWFDELSLGLVIGCAVAINLIVASFSGVAIPLLLKRIGSDPALSGAVILTMVTDVVGFMSFLGLATLFLL